MTHTRLYRSAFLTLRGLTLVVATVAFLLIPLQIIAQGEPPHAPRYRVDHSWPKPLPANWLVGQVGGIAVDRNDNIWIIQRQRSLTNDEAWATDAIALRCADGEIVDFFGACTDGTVPEPIDGLGNPRPNGPLAECCVPAPAVIKFDGRGNFLDGWGGPAEPGFVGRLDGVVDSVCDPDAGCWWPAGEQSIYVDHNDFVYIAGNGIGTGNCAGNPCPWAGTHGADAMVLKFAADGTFIYQIGDPDPAGAPDSNDTGGASNGTPQPFRPADMEVDPVTNDLYIADGYGNHRVLVVDADTGQYLRHWGAYGQNPVDDTGQNADPIGADPNFKNPVHCVRIVGDLVYVCDRINNRIQIFDKNVAGATCTNPGQQVGVCGYLGEVFIGDETLGNGSTWDVETSSDEGQSCLLVADGTNQKVWILDREGLETLNAFGRGGRSAGQFHWVRSLVTDSKGNLYTAEVDTGKRTQKFTRQGSKGCKL
jgi:hypothetical protein